MISSSTKVSIDCLENFVSVINVYQCTNASWLLSDFSASFESFVKFCIANKPKYKEQMLVDGILVQLS